MQYLKQEKLSRVRLKSRPALTRSHFIVARAEPGLDQATQVAGAYCRIGEALCRSGMEIVQERVFGNLDAEKLVRTVRRETLQAHGLCPNGPITYLEGRPVDGDVFAGVIVHAVAGTEVQTLHDGGIRYGRTWNSGTGRVVILQNIQGISEHASDLLDWGAQARTAIGRAAKILEENGASYRDVARTWFYLSDLLNWYPEFNAARNASYRRFGLLGADNAQPARLPASTGIRANVPTGAGCALDLVAIADATTAFSCVRNPFQPEAFSYGSAFSRCTVLTAGATRLIEVSGTAAIDEQGRSLHPGDVQAQIRCTLEKIGVLLEQANATLADVSAATIFLKDRRHAAAAREELARAGLAELPAVWVEADVCRGELLFEMDAEVAFQLP